MNEYTFHATCQNQGKRWKKKNIVIIITLLKSIRQKLNNIIPRKKKLKRSGHAYFINKARKPFIKRAAIFSKVYRARSKPWRSKNETYSPQSEPFCSQNEPYRSLKKRTVPFTNRTELNRATGLVAHFRVCIFEMIDLIFSSFDFITNFNNSAFFSIKKNIASKYC